MIQTEFVLSNDTLGRFERIRFSDRVDGFNPEKIFLAMG